MNNKTNAKLKSFKCPFFGKPINVRRHAKTTENQMKYQRLQIDTDGTIETYDKITKLLAVEPSVIDLDSKLGQPYDLWTYQIDTNDEDNFDFINKFLDILDLKLADLENLGVTRDKILFWLLYEYDQQCALEFHPKEMKRLGDSGIHLNIDCWPVSTDKSTNA